MNPVPEMRQPAPKSGCSPGCRFLATLLLGMFLGAAITVIAEIALIAAGVGWLSDAINSDRSWTRSSPTSTSTASDPVPTEFNGVDNDTLDSLCNSAVLDPKITEACRQREKWVCDHGGPCSAY